MTSKKATRDHWFEMTAGPNQVGDRITRYYVVKCKCGVSASHHATNASDEHLRKIFMRDGWDIGRTISAHLCPGCKNRKLDKNKPKAEPKLAPVYHMPQPSVIVPPLSLVAAWQAASDEERGRLWKHLDDQCRAEGKTLELGPIKPLTINQAWLLAGEQERRDFVTQKSMEWKGARFNIFTEKAIYDVNGVLMERKPEPEPEPEPANTSEPEPEPVSDDDDDAPADWWRELMEKRRA